MKGIIAAGHPLTAEAGAEVMRAGGNAFDAVVAALATACVVEPVLASLGGGCFMLARPRGAPARVYDAFVQTPRHKRSEDELDFGPITADFGTATQEFHTGRGSIATPGVVRGLFAIIDDLCRMDARALLEPAIGHARVGVELNAFQGYIFRIVAPIYQANADVLAHYSVPGATDRLVDTGDVLRQNELADVLEVLAAEGDDLFYRGEIAERIARDLAAGGHLVREDFEHYRVERRHPLAIAYRGHRILTNPPPASGGVLSAITLRLLASRTVAGCGFGSRQHLDLLAGALAVTQTLRDSAQAMAVEELLSEQHLAAFRDSLPGHAPATRGTTQISVIDADGNLASLTASNGEGASYLVPQTGIMMNNMLGEQDLNHTGFHRWPCDVRMTSMMTPTAVFGPDGREAALGSGGSNRIRSAVTQVISNLVDFAMPVQQAVEAPRLHVEGRHLSIEGGFEPGMLDLPCQRFPDHNTWPDLNLFFGGAHTVVAGPDGLDGAGDPRRGGVCVRS